MPFSALPDDEILKALAAQFDSVRLQKGIKDQELVARGGTNGVAMGKFRAGENITLKTFVRLMRGLGELDRLESMLSLPETWSPTGEAKKPAGKRVRSKKDASGTFSWGDES
jgi:DNA-binding Xre family transcriptional regulator